MDGLSQAVAAYIAEHGEIDRETYKALEQIYATEAGGRSSAAAVEADLKAIDELLVGLKAAGSVKVKDQKLDKIVQEAQDLFKQTQTRKKQLMDAIDEIC